MASELKVNKISPESGLTLTLGDTGDTINFGSGVLPNFENLTVTGDLTVDTNSLKVDSTNNYVGIGTASPSVALDVVGAITASGNITGTLATAAQPNITSLGTLTGLTTTGNIDLGDSDRLRLGASQDLQIFHDGSHSNIIDNGSGNLRLGGDTQIYLGRFSGDTPSEAYATFNSNGAVNLYYDNAVKLATTSTGIDVTGTVVSDGLTVDTTTLVVDATNNRVGIGTSTPSYTLQVDHQGAENVTIVAKGTAPGFGLYDTTASAYNWALYNSNGELAFYNTLNTNGFNSLSEKMRITTAGNVGIGTSTPSRKLTVTGGEVEIRDGNYFMMRPSGNAWDMRLQAVSTRLDVVSGGDTANPIATFVHGGNVGIGTTSPSANLDIRFSSTNTSPTPNNANLRVLQTTGGTNGYFSSINLGTSTVGDGADSLIVNYGITNGQSALAFFTDNLNTCSERMRIDQNGRVGIGTSSPSSTLDVTGAGGGLGSIYVYGGGGGSVDTRLIVGNTGNGGSGRGTGILIKASGSSSSVDVVKLIGYQETAASTANNAKFAIQVANSSGTLTERVSINNTGVFNITGSLTVNGSAVGGAGSIQAWVNFNGTGTVAIRDSGNVSSVTDNGTGQFTANFTSSLASADYASVLGISNDVGSTTGGSLFSKVQTQTTSAVRVASITPQGNFYDPNYFAIGVII